MGNTVARLRVGDSGPAILLSGHCRARRGLGVPNARLRRHVSQLPARNIAWRELEIPHSPCATFTMAAAQRYAIYQLVRPDAVHLFDGRSDP